MENTLMLMMTTTFWQYVFVIVCTMSGWVGGMLVLWSLVKFEKTRERLRRMESNEDLPEPYTGLHALSGMTVEQALRYEARQYRLETARKRYVQEYGEVKVAPRPGDWEKAQALEKWREELMENAYPAWCALMERWQKEQNEKKQDEKEQDEKEQDEKKQDEKKQPGPEPQVPGVGEDRRCHFRKRLASGIEVYCKGERWDKVHDLTIKTIDPRWPQHEFVSKSEAEAPIGGHRYHYETIEPLAKKEVLDTL